MVRVFDPALGDFVQRHVLQCLCECDDFDALATECIDDSCARCSACCCCCCGSHHSSATEDGGHRFCSAAQREKLRRVLVTAADRARVPWFGGARKVNAGVIVSALLLKLLREACDASDQASWVIFWLGFAAGHLVLLHLACLSIPWRTDFFVSWLSFSFAWVYVDYYFYVLPGQGWALAIAMHALLGLVVIAFCAAVLRCPAPGLTVAMPTSEGGFWPLSDDRCYPCRICGQHVHRRDHHCVWINQCVGSHNHRAFLVFVAGFALLALSYTAAACSGTAWSAKPPLSAADYLASLVRARCIPRPIASALYALMGGVLSLMLFVSQASNISMGLTTHERLRIDRAREGAERWAGIGTGSNEGSNANSQNGSAKHAIDGDRQPARQHCWRHPFDRGSYLANWTEWWRDAQQASCKWRGGGLQEGSRSITPTSITAHDV